jgi:hypothetical protein
MQYGGLLTRRVLGVGSARAGSVARVPGRPLVMGSLNDAVDWALLWVEIIQPVVRAYRVRVCRCPGAVLRTGKRNARRARRARHLTSGSGTCACTRNRDSARRSREEGLRAHIPSPFPSVCCSDRTLLTRRYGVNRGLTSAPASSRDDRMKRVDANATLTRRPRKSGISCLSSVASLARIWCTARAWRLHRRRRPRAGGSSRRWDGAGARLGSNTGMQLRANTCNALGPWRLAATPFCAALG